MKTYKFYTKDALLIDESNLFQNNDIYVVINSLTHCAVSEPLCRKLKLNRHFEIFDCDYSKWLSEDIIYSEFSYEDCLTMTAAIAYDVLRHPDETVFVTANPQMALFMNKYFGEDSIILLEEDRDEKKIKKEN